MMNRRSRRKIAATIGTIFFAPIVAMLLVMLLLYVPPVQRFVIEKIGAAVENSSGYNLSMGAFRLHFPLNVAVSDYVLSHKGDTLLDGENLRLNIAPIPLLRGEIEVNYISIDNTVVDSYSLIKGVRIAGKIGYFRTAIRNLDIVDESILISQLNLTESRVSLTKLPHAVEDDTVTAASSNWIITLNKARLSDVDLSMENPQDTAYVFAHFGTTKLQNAIIDLKNGCYSLHKADFAACAAKYDSGNIPDSIAPTKHISFDEIKIGLSALKYSREAINAKLDNLSMRQQPCGIMIDNGAFTVVGDTNRVALRNLKLNTLNGSRLQANVAAPFTLLKDHDGKGSADAEILLALDKRDLQGFIPADDYSALNDISDSLLHVYTRLRGNMRSAFVDTLYASIPGFAEFGLVAEGSNLLNEKKRSFDVGFSGNVCNVQRALRVNAPSAAAKPLRMSGSAALYNGEYSADIELVCGDGRATASASYVASNSSYQAKIDTRCLDVEEILPTVPLSDIDAHLYLSGEGYDVFNDSTQYNCTLSVDSLRFADNLFSGMLLTAVQKNSRSLVMLKSDADILQVELMANSLFDNRTIENHTTIDAKNIDVSKFGFSSMPVQASLKMDVEAFTDLCDTYMLKSVGDDVNFLFKGKCYSAKDFNLIATTKPDSTMLSLSTGDLDMDACVEAGYKKIVESVQRVTHYVENELSFSSDTIFNLQECEQMIPAARISVYGKDKNLLADYLKINGVTYKEANLNLSLDSVYGLNARGMILDLEHDKQHLDTARIALLQDSSALKYFVGVRSRAMNSNEDKATFGAALYGALTPGELTTNYVFRDKSDVIAMKVGVATTLTGDGVMLRFNPRATLFRQPCTFNNDNYVSLDRNMNIRADVELRDTTNLGVNVYATSDTVFQRDIFVDLFNVDLSTATRVLPFAPNMGGIVNADLHYRQNDENVIIGCDVRSNGLEYEGTLIGNETVEFSYLPRGPKEHFANLTLYHNDEKIAGLEGVYNTDSLGKKDKGDLHLTKFPLSMANAFLRKSNVAAGGYIDGTMSVTNDNDHPVAEGYISFDSAYADLPDFGTTLHLVNDKIEVVGNILKLNGFNLYAKGETPFKIDGTIDFNSPLNPNFNLMMRANNYEIVNSRRSRNSILYGRMFLNIGSRITGRLNALNVSGTATVLGNSDITYVLQDTPLETENMLDGLVTFTNFADTTETVPEIPEYDLGDVNLNLRLAIEEGARINADFDRERNSYIELQGEGNLNLTYTAEAGMNLTGRYRLSNGIMKYNLPVIPLKTFNIKEGSIINWTGDIMNPVLDISAVERVVTSVTIDDNSQAVPFDVGVKLSNTLDDMGLNFTLSSPENAAVQNQLNSVDAETLNKYALTMLIAGAYIGGENSLSVSTALTSFLDTQINNFVGNAVNNSVDINVGITDLQDAATGDSYKNYSFSFTKRFWNDRVKVVIGGEVSDNAHANTNESFINNVSLEWKISNSGNRYLRLFYDKNYESILEGEITEAGVGYMYKRKLNNLNELLIFKKKSNGANFPQKSLPPTPKENISPVTNEIRPRQ